jgi:hypothetical protein
VECGIWNLESTHVGSGISHLLTMWKESAIRARECDIIPAMISRKKKETSITKRVTMRLERDIPILMGCFGVTIGRCCGVLWRLITVMCSVLWRLITVM